MISPGKPLVLVFAGKFLITFYTLCVLKCNTTGLSGHGKTEIERSLGSLLSLDTTVIDMTQIRHESDLFGPHAPFVDHEKGSLLNNFLWDHTGKRAIIMLDEIEKADPRIIDTLLIVFDEGKDLLYQSNSSRKLIRHKTI
jgi:ATP-dependent Clp protease ATP-binding subunit ClpA